MEVATSEETAVGSTFGFVFSLICTGDELSRDGCMAMAGTWDRIRWQFGGSFY